MRKKTTQPLYYVFGIAIAVLVGLIGYFTYLLLAPSSPTATNTNTSVVSNANKNKNSNANKNGNTNANTNKNANGNTNADGLVEPDEDETNSNTNTTNTNSNSTSNSNRNTSTVKAGEGEKVITLYFTKSGAKCGEVFPVQRAVTPEDDFYGQIILAAMHGPESSETGYTSAIPSSLRLRWVEYTADGPQVYVNEAFDELDDCKQQTVEAQLVETANAMFDLKEGSEGDVVVGYPDDTEADTNSNTNSSN